MNLLALKVEQRDRPGKGPAQRLRQTGKIPGVCYGRDIKPLSISLDPQDLLAIVRGPRGLNSLIRLDGAEDRTVLVQDLQRDPVTRDIIHVDFVFVDTKKPIQRDVPVELVGKPEGVKAGGVLQVTSREILVEALPTMIPDRISINVEQLLIGQSIHIEEVQLPQGVVAVYDRNYNVCAIVAPTEEKEPEKEAEALALEGEAPAEGAAEGAKPAEGEKPAAEKKESKTPEEKRDRKDKK